MKTINTDLGAFLKRDGYSMTLGFDGKAFVVKCGGEMQMSTYLDDALENLAEAMRRRANQMAPVRETKPEPLPAAHYSIKNYFATSPSTTATPPKPSNYSAIPSISQAGQQAYQQQQAAATHCPVCGRLPNCHTASTPRGSSNYRADHVGCAGNHSWQVSPVKYKLDGGSTYYFDGNRWDKSVP